ncbi:MAG: gamma-glutamylcyclotransferase family protein [Pseudomonadota bacterium]|nr:gamma-glutamylcyclotransferase family protein [Pseudomonadota bacterium]
MQRPTIALDTVNYLAYGSNLYPPRLRLRVPIVETVGMVELPGWALDFGKRGGDGSGKCNLAERASAMAFGVVYIISAPDKLILDRIEGLGRGYQDHWIEIATIGRCVFYRAIETAIDTRLKPYDWYKGFVLAGARLHRFPQPYVDAIDAVPSQPDPDAARHAENDRILQQELS